MAVRGRGRLSAAVGARIGKLSARYVTDSLLRRRSLSCCSCPRLRFEVDTP